MTVRFRVAIITMFLISCVAFTLIQRVIARPARANITSMSKEHEAAVTLPFSKSENGLFKSGEAELFGASSIYFEPLLLLLMGSALLSFATGVRLIVSRKPKKNEMHFNHIKDRGARHRLSAR